jgi:hypothetical protein
MMFGLLFLIFSATPSVAFHAGLPKPSSETRGCLTDLDQIPGACGKFARHHRIATAI